MPKNKLINLALVFFGLVIIDQVLKLIFVRFYVFSLNTAGVWGISFFGGPVYFVAFVLFIVLGTYLFTRANLSFFSSLGLTMIASGAISNFIDRIVRGGVIDIFDTGFWPIFNLSDVMIFIGVLLFGYGYLKSKA